MVGREHRPRIDVQHRQGFPQPDHRAQEMGRTARTDRCRQPLRTRHARPRKPAHHGRILVAQYEQTAPPRPCAQQFARMGGVENRRGQRQPRGEDQHCERSRYSHLQVDAGLAQVWQRRDARVDR